jgi:hypothetical protein
VTKEQIDKYFTNEWDDIQSIIKRNAPKCATANSENITSDIYLICIEKAPKIKDIRGFIRIVASNIYRWENSDFNKNNRIFAHTNDNLDTYIGDELEDYLRDQQREYAIELYRRNAEPHQLIFADIVMNEKIFSIRDVMKRVGTTHHGARILINDFKTKIQSYERQTEVKED